MKTAIYIQDGVQQVVLSPENDFEKKALDIFHQGEKDFEIYRGSFYECQGGWIRFQPNQIVNSMFNEYSSGSSDDSTIVIARNKSNTSEKDEPQP